MSDFVTRDVGLRTPQPDPATAYELWLGASIILALATLTDKERDAVVSRHIRGDTYATIAARQGVNRQAVQLCERRGLAKLQTALQPLHDDLLEAA